jgi:hypothetical protein
LPGKIILDIQIKLAYHLSNNCGIDFGASLTLKENGTTAVSARRLHPSSARLCKPSFNRTARIARLEHLLTRRPSSGSSQVSRGSDMSLHKQILRSLVVAVVLHELAIASPQAIKRSRKGNEDTYEFLMERVFNPALTNEEEVVKWASEYGSLLARIVDLDTTVSDEHFKLMHVIQDFIPEFLASEQYMISNGLFMAFKRNVDGGQTLAEAMVSAYHDIARVFQEKLGLAPPRGFLFALVVKDRAEIGDEEIGGFVIRGSRFIVIPQAYYFQYGFRLPDVEQFRNNFKHELVHAFVNTSAGFEHSTSLPEWFHEMAAISLGANKKFALRGEGVVRLSTLYQEYHDAASHLKKKSGEAKYYAYLRQSIKTGDPLKGLSEIYGYESYEDLRWDSMDVLEKFSEKSSSLFKKIKQVLRQSSLSEMAFGLLLVLFPFALVYPMFRQRHRFRKNLQDEFLEAERTQSRGEEEQSVMAYRAFLESLTKANESGALFIGFRKQSGSAKQRLHALQKNILDKSREAIEKNLQKEVIKAEEQCYSLDDKINGALFEGAFANEARAYLDVVFPEVVSNAWKTRKASFEKLCAKSHHLEAIKECLAYAQQHHRSSYYPGRTVASQLKTITNSLAEAYNRASTAFDACSDTRKLDALYSTVKSYKTLSSLQGLLVELRNEIAGYCRLAELREMMPGANLRDCFSALGDLLAILQSYYHRPALRDQALASVDQILSTLDSGIDDDSPDAKLFMLHAYPAMKREILERILEIVEANNDVDEAARVQEKIRGLPEIS